MPDPLTPEHKERIRKAIDREAGTGGLSPAAAAVWISYCEALLAALAAAEAERDAARADLTIADTLAQTLINENVALRSPRPPGEGESDG